MKRTALLLSMVLCAAAGPIAIAQDRDGSPSDAAARRDADRQALAKTVDAFTKAYNSGDAKAIAGQFLPRGELVDEQGNTFSGQEAIEAEFAAFFKEHPEARAEIVVESLRFVSASIALEEGITYVKLTDDSPEMPSRYTVVHVKKDGQWRVASVKDTAIDASSNYHKLEPLAWLVGEWVDEGRDSLVATNCRWSKNKNYLLRDFRIRIAGLPAMDGTQRIGWDPLTKKIKSWVFDSEGAYGEGLWTQDGDRWIVKVTGVLRDGRVASSTNTFTPVSDDTISWESRDRIVGGERTPDVAVTIVRKPPAPQ